MQKIAADELELKAKLAADELAFKHAESERAAKQRDDELAMRRLEHDRQVERDRADARNQEAEIARRDAEANRRANNDAREHEFKNSAVSRAKLFGDAMRNSVPRMPNDPMEVLAFFRNVEDIFEMLEVPVELQGILVRPFLNDKAKLLVVRLDQVGAVSYKDIKTLILAEFQLTPAVYRDRFNALVKESGETYIMYVSRLRALLNYYLNARHVEEKDDLIELLICDRVKSVLSENCLKYVLSAEARVEKGWVDSKQLADCIDGYSANHGVNDRPKASALGAQSNQKPNEQNVQRTGGQKPQYTTPKTNNPTPPHGTCQPQTQGKPPPRCWTCNALGHRAAACPQKGSGQSGGQRRVLTCVSGRRTTGPTADCLPVERAPASKVTVDRSSIVTGVECHVNSDAVAIASPAATDAGDGKLVALIRCEADRDNDHHGSLRYVSVNIAGELGSGVSSRNVHGIYDSGAEISVVHSDVIKDLPDINVVGRTQLCGVFGEPVNADLIKLNVSLNETGRADKYLNILCASSNQTRHELILAADVVDRLLTADADVCDCDVCGETLGSDTDGKYNPASGDVSDDNIMSHAYTDRDECGVHVTSVVIDGTAGSDEAAVPLANSVTDTVDGTDPSPGVTLESETILADDGFQPVDCYDADDVREPKENMSSQERATRQELIDEQLQDESLQLCWSLMKQNKGNYFVDDGLLVHRERILGQDYTQVVLPSKRRSIVLEMGHKSIGCHLSTKRTNERIRLSYVWPTLTKDVKTYISQCFECQKRRKVTYRDRVPIQPIPRADIPFSHWFMDCLGPISSEKLEYNYCLVMVDSSTRYPAAFALRSLTAKNICDCLMQVFMYFGMATYVTSDNASNFSSKLNAEFLKRLGCSPRFITPYHASANGLAERMVGTVKSMVSKVAVDHPKSWQRHLGFIMWALREVPNETTGVAPYLLAMGRLPRGPLAVLRDSWCGERPLPFDLGKTPVQYLTELRENLEIANSYADSHAKRAQQRYVSRYNLRSADKHFTCGDQVLILQPDSTKSRLFSRWKGPAVITAEKSPYSYEVELDGKCSLLHANQLRKFYQVQSDMINAVSCMSYDAFIADEYSTLQSADIATCAIVHEKDEDFGPLGFGETSDLDSDPNGEVLPSQKLDQAALAHLKGNQQSEILRVLDKYPSVFSETPGLVTVVEHAIPTTSDFRPKQLRPYRVPDRLQGEVHRQVSQLLDLGFIKPSTSPMASPVVCVMKGQGGKDGVRIVVDYRYLNKYTEGDAYPFPLIDEVVQRIGNATFISTFDARSGYWQTRVREEDQWKTAFICDDGLFEWTRTAFGMKSSGSTFVRAVQRILQPIKAFTDSYVDDMAVISDTWELHLSHVDQFLHTIEKSGMTLSLQKCRFAQSEVKFCGQIVGKGCRRPDPEKVSAVEGLKVPTSKTETRQICGFFAYFRDHIKDFAEIAKPLTDLTSKKVPERIPWGDREQNAFDALKTLLINATKQCLHIIDKTKPFILSVDASDYAVSGILSQTGENGIENPVAFSSMKLNSTQRAWATVEKEAYAVIAALRKFRGWVFGTRITVYSDHNPLTYLTLSAPKSAKLMRWALALQEFDVEFRFRSGKTNVAADTLSRLGPDM